MNLALHVLSPPYHGQGCRTALHFAEAALAQGHTISRVFFSGEGVLIGNQWLVPPQDESNLHQRWRELADQHGVELILCISAALKRGMLDAPEANRHEKSGFCIDAPFILSGLGQLVEAGLINDRLITFGN